VSGSGISWAICTSAPCSRQITMPVPHHSVFYRPDALPAAQPTASKHWRLVIRHQFTINRWRTVVSGTWKYDDPKLNMSHEGAARVWHVQPREVLFPCPTNDCPSYVLSSDQLQESWIIRELKSYSPLYLHDLNTQARRVIFDVSKTLCDFGHKNSFKEE